MIKIIIIIGKMTEKNTNAIALFDIDGTLTTPRGKITSDMIDTLKQLSTKMLIGVVGGSDFIKQKEQLGDVVEWVDYAFSENGLVVYQGNQLIHTQRLTDAISNEQINTLVNFCLHSIANLDMPVKRGTFIEFRTGMINISPIGRGCNQQERDAFQVYDKQHSIRQTMVNQLNQQFGHVFSFAIGGQISIDCYPIGWDKTYCLPFLTPIQHIYFFGDKTDIGGNDYAIYNDPRVIGYKVNNYKETIDLIHQLWL